MLTLSHAAHFVLFKVLEVIEGLAGFHLGELLLELVCVHVVLFNHLIDVFNVRFQIILRFPNPFVPQHGQKPLDVSLGYLGVFAHVEVNTVVVSGQDVCLHALDAFILVLVPFADNIATPASLDGGRCIVFAHVFDVLVPITRQLAFHGCLNFDESASDALYKSPCLEAPEDTLYVDNKILLGVN